MEGSTRGSGRDTMPRTNFTCSGTSSGFRDQTTDQAREVHMEGMNSVGITTITEDI